MSPLPALNHLISGSMTLLGAAQAAAGEAPWWMPLVTLLLWGLISYCLKRMEGRDPRKALVETLQELEAERRAREAAERRLAGLEGRDAGPERS